MASQKVLVFIDTNIYLRFFDSKQSNFKKLLKSLEEINKYIFITQQVIDEINRNKQDLFKRSFDGYINQSKLLSTELPEHISTSTDEKIKKWNQKRKKLEDISKSQSAELSNISNDMLNEIQKNEDDISKVLKTISQDAQKPRKKLLRKARIRKELGNPPGKKDDPIGDQLNWELLLEYIISEEIEDLIFISTDNDFFISHNGKVELNAMLYNELIEISDTLKVYCYGSLAEGLKKFNELKQIKNLPNSDILEKIRTEEIKSENELLTPFSWNTGATSHYGNLGLLANTMAPSSIFSTPNLFTKCPHCGQPTFHSIFDIKDGKVISTKKCLNCGFDQQ